MGNLEKGGVLEEGRKDGDERSSQGERGKCSSNSQFLYDESKHLQGKQ